MDTRKKDAILCRLLFQSRVCSYIAIFVLLLNLFNFDRPDFIIVAM